VSRRRSPQEVAAIFAAEFPHAFKSDGTPRAPLQLRIFGDLQKRLRGRVRRRELQAALAYCLTQPDYQRLVAQGGTRIDLDGRHVGRQIGVKARAFARRLQARHEPSEHAP
jgi:sRNA-binding protein